MKKLLLPSLLSLVMLFLAGQDPLQARSTKTMVGQKLPNLNLDYLQSAPNIKGKPLIVEFWATWCPPCRQSIPHLNEIYEKYKGRDLEIIGVTEENNNTIRAFTKTVPIKYAAATDRGGALNKAFGVEGIPHAVLVNREGVIVWEGHPMSLKESDIEAVLTPSAGSGSDSSRPAS